MTLPPLVERELRVAARREATYRLRAATAGLFLLLGGWPVFAFDQSSGAMAGEGAFFFLSGLAWLGCLFEGVRLTVDSLSRERRDGTLGLLFLTNLTSRDVALGKLAPAALQGFYGLLAVVPVLGLTLLAGGVTVGQVARVALALLAALALALTVGLLASASSRDAGKSWLSAGLLLLTTGWLPGWALVAAGTGRRFALSLTLTFGVVALFLMLAVRILRNSWRSTEHGTVAEAASPSAPPATGMARWVWSTRKRSLDELKWLEQRPAMWLAMRGSHRSSGEYLGLAIVAMVVAVAGVLLGGALVVGPVLMITGGFAVVLGLIVAWEAGRSLAELRRSGLAEVLLTTPLDARDIPEAFRAALVDRFAFPVCLVLGVQTLTPLVAALVGAGGGDAGVAVMILLGGNVWVLGQFIVAAQVGLYFGFKHGSAVKAFGWAMLVAVAMPLVLMPFFLCLGPFQLVVMVAVPFMIASVSRERLREGFRQMVAGP